MKTTILHQQQLKRFNLSFVLSVLAILLLVFSSVSLAESQDSRGGRYKWIRPILDSVVSIGVASNWGIPAIRGLSVNSDFERGRNLPSGLFEPQFEQVTELDLDHN